jgi:gliding motility-associated-like protein
LTNRLQNIDYDYKGLQIIQMRRFKQQICIISCVLITSLSPLWAQTPIVKSLDVESGYSGQLINIKGSEFESSARIFFGGVEGTTLSVSDQLIETKVPSGATFDNVTVLNPTSGLSGSSISRFLLSYGGTSGVSITDFDSQQDFFAESGLFDVCACDLDGDFKNDVIGANSKSNTATILRNISTPGVINMVKTPIGISATTLNVTCGDLTGDGKPEIIFTEGTNGSRIFVLVNFSTPGSLSFLLQPINITGSSTKRVIISDLDLDGKPDMIVTDQSKNKVYLVKNTSASGTFSFDSNITELTVANAGSAAGLEVQDMNGDSRPDIIVNQFLTDGGGFYIATNNSTSGSFSFSNFKQFASAGTFVNMKVGDINGDTKPDIAASLFLSSSVAVFINETSNIGGSPSFSAAKNITTDERPWGIDFADMDGDGRKDIIVSTVGASHTVNVLNNNSSSSFDFQKVSIPVTYINRNIKAADIDGDGKPEMIFSSVDDESQGIAASKISILRNNNCIIPIVTPEGPISVCSGNNLRLETQLIEGAIYEWEKNGTLESTGTDNFLDVIISGDYTVTILMEGGSCSEISNIVIVEVKAAGALPSPIITANTPVCIGGSLTLTAQNVGATTYSWRGPEGFTQTGISVVLNDFRFNNTGKYFLDVFSGDCIIETKSIVIDAISSPDFSVQQSGSGVYCQGDPVTLTASPNDVNFSFQWFDDNGAVSGATGINYSPTSSGNYYAQATDLINTSCPAIKTSLLTVDFLALPQAQFSFQTSVCTNSPINFTNESIEDGNATISYLWDFGDGDNATSRNSTHSYTNDSTFNVSLTVSYDGLSCSDQLTLPITINGNLNIEIMSSSLSICEGDDLELSVDEDLASYTWSTNETSSSITITEGGTYTVTVSDSNGCQGTDDIVIGQFAKPIVEVSSSANNINAGDTVILMASGLSNYNWTPGRALSDSLSAEVQATLIKTTVFSVTGADINGCSGSGQIEIIVIQENAGNVLVPNKFFSPNGDNANDNWEVKKIGDFPQCGVEIYDQSGNKLFDSKPYMNNWDGTSQGKQLPDGVYYFVIKCDTDGIVKSGSITLLR